MTADVLVIAVAYDSPDESRSFVERALAYDGPRVDFVLADNSPEPTVDPVDGRVRVLSYPDNPGYVGAARRVVAAIAGERVCPLAYRAVVLANVDVEIDYDALVASVDDAHEHTRDLRWVLAPRVLDRGARFEPNPAGSVPTAERRRGWLLRRSFVAFAAYWWLSLRRRARFENPHAGSPRWSPMYRCYGACMVFGAGYFSVGGVFHAAPLFNEEEAFARIAQHIDAPILYEPQLVVHHDPGITYANRKGAYRRRFEWHRASEQFYDGWHPSHVVGAMSTWFSDEPHADAHRGVPR